MKLHLSKLDARRYKLNAKKGFTLVELLLHMALLAILLITLTDIFVSILDVRLESDATSAVEQDGRLVLARLAYDINRADAIANPALGASSNSLGLTISGVSYTYAIVSSNLQLTNNLGTNNLNGSETTIPSITFQRIGNVGGKHTIKINFTINSQTQRNKGLETRTFNTTVGLR